MIVRPLTLIAGLVVIAQPALADTPASVLAALGISGLWSPACDQPVSRQAPRVSFVPEADPYVNPLGVKGIGEIGITGVPAAIASAVFNATGKRIRELPITLDKLL